MGENGKHLSDLSERCALDKWPALDHLLSSREVVYFWDFCFPLLFPFTERGSLAHMVGHQGLEVVHSFFRGFCCVTFENSSGRNPARLHRSLADLTGG
jgi:hypothetical protein